MPRIGILNGGGDCPGLNTVIDSVVRSLSPDYDVLGFYKGFEGLLANEYIHLKTNEINRYKFAGGTILKSTNTGHFAGKVGEGESQDLDPKIIQKTIQHYKELELECLVVLGGDGTLSAANQLQKAGLNIIGIPKSIDNDLYGTELTFGFLTAVDIATEAMDRLETTAVSHDRVMILEVMGRHAGWIALYSGLAGGANAILIPEIPFEYESLTNLISKRAAEGKTHTLIIVAEGAKAKDSQQSVVNSGGKSSEVLLGGISDEIAKKLNKFGIDARATRLGHIQRGGSPNSRDRILSMQMGAYASEMVRNKKYAQVVVYQKSELGTIPLKEAVSKLKRVDIKSPSFKLCRVLGVSFGE